MDAASGLDSKVITSNGVADETEPIIIMDIDQYNELRLGAETFKVTLLQLKLEVKNVLLVLRAVMTKLNKANVGLDPPFKRLCLGLDFLQPHMDELTSDVAELNSDFNVLVTGSKNTSSSPSSCDTVPSGRQGGSQIYTDAKDTFTGDTFLEIKLKPFDTEDNIHGDLIISRVPEDGTSGTEDNTSKDFIDSQVPEGITSGIEDIRVLEDVVSGTEDIRVLEDVVSGTEDNTCKDFIDSQVPEGITSGTEDIRVLEDVTSGTEDNTCKDFIDSQVPEGITSGTEDIRVLEDVTSGTEDIRVLEDVVSGTEDNTCKDYIDSQVPEGITNGTEDSTHKDLIDSRVPGKVTSETRPATKASLKGREKRKRSVILNSVAKSKKQHAKQEAKTPRLIGNGRKVTRQNLKIPPSGKNVYTCSVCGKYFKTKLGVSNCKHRESLPKSYEDLEKNYSCSVCGLLFTKFLEFRAHYASHCLNTDEPFECKLCDRKFSNPIDLNRHTIAHEGKNFSCETCGKSFKTPLKLHQHRKRHLKLRLSCGLCTRTFVKAETLKEHMNVHLGERRIECDICHKKFPTTKSMVNHKGRVHTKTCLHNKCPVCGLVFKSNYTRDTHCLSHTAEELKSHNIVIEMVECKECGKSMVKSKLSCHMGIHRRQKQQFVCEFCGIFFSGMHTYRVHTCSRRECKMSASMNSSQTGVSKEVHMCDICGKSFEKKSSLAWHRKVHTEEMPRAHQDRKPHACEDRKPHACEDGKPHACVFCGKKFRFKQGLHCHVRTHTRERPFPCKFCPKSFMSFHNLQRHVDSVHKGIRKFACDVCGKCFAQKNGLKVHSFIHTGEKPFNCDICGQKFSDQSSIYKHKKRLHKNDTLQCNT